MEIFCKVKKTCHSLSAHILLFFSNLVMSDTFVTSCTVSCQAPLFIEFSRQKYWSGLPFPTGRDLSYWKRSSPCLLLDIWILYPWAICVHIVTLYLALSIQQLWSRQWHPTPVLLPGKSHVWRSLVGWSPWGC